VALDEQHFICAGPGHWLETLVPAQSEVQRQLPEEPLAQDGLEQHFLGCVSWLM
jgi:hypothetical protein